MPVEPFAEPQAPALRIAPSLAEVPSSARPAGAERVHAWQFLGTTPEEAARSQLELERQDRAMVALRRQVHLARQSPPPVRAPNAVNLEPAVWGAGALAMVTGLGWLFERRRRISMQEPPREPLSVQHLTVMPAEPELTAAGLEPTGVSDFDSFESVNSQDAADLWIRRAGVALPEPGTRRVATQ